MGGALQQFKQLRRQALKNEKPFTAPRASIHNKMRVLPFGDNFEIDEKTEKSFNLKHRHCRLPASRRGLDRKKLSKW